MRKTIGGLVVVGAVVAVTLGIGPTFDFDSGSTALASEPLPTAQAIGLFEQRVELNSSDAVSRTVLGELLTRRSRETGNTDFVDEAELTLKSALALLPNYPRAEAALATVYISQHKFLRALELAEKAYASEPDGDAILAVGDAQLALGRYDEARRSFTTAYEVFPAPLVAARIARIDEIHGDVQSARAKIDKAALVFAESGGSGEPAAWLQMRRGDLAFHTGDYAAAETAYRNALAILPEHPASIAGLARSLEALGDRAGAISNWEKVTELQPHPEILLALAEMYQVDGQTAKAEATFVRMAQLSEESRGLFELAVAFYEADHGDTQIAVETAELLVETRPDLYSYDALAWASFRNGDLDEARRASDAAVSTGSGDARLWYHSGAIWAALGQDTKAIADLEHALELSPRFDPIGAAEAQRLLAEIRG